MSYFVSIYTDPIIYDKDKFTDFTNILSVLFGIYGFTHTFISLTHKSPIDLAKENKYWYKKLYPSILEYGNGGSADTDKGSRLYDYLNGKIFENII